MTLYEQAVEMAKKGEQKMRLLPLVPRMDMVELRGKYEELMRRDFYEAGGFKDAYVHITLTDEQDVPEAFRRLNEVYPNLMQMEYDNTRTRQKREIHISTENTKRNPLEMFANLYETMNNQPLSEVQQEYIQKKIDAIWKGEA
jgi:exonuclease SbcD